MLGAEEQMEIAVLRRHGMSIRAIARATGLSRNTVRRLTLQGGAGDDALFAVGGIGAILVGGEGRDFLFNTSFEGQLYGDTIDGIGQAGSGQRLAA